MTTTTKKKNNFLFIGLVLILVGCIALVLILFQDDEYTTSSKDSSDYHSIFYKNTQYTYNTSMIHILFMGIDSSEDRVGQADAMQLYTLDRKHQKISVLSIDRDTMTPIHLYDVSHNSLGWKKQHLALAYAYGMDAKNGALLTCKAVSKMLYDIPINKYVALNLDDLDKVQEVVGTLDVVVPNDSLAEINPLWTKGSTITLDSSNVETFVRARDTEKDFSNEDRMERQKVYLNAYYAKLKEVLDTNYQDTLNKLYDLIKTVTNNVTYDEVESYVKMFQTYSYNEKTSYKNLPGKNRVSEMHDEFILDKKALKQFIVQQYYKKV